MRYLNILILLISSFYLVTSCGITTHTEIGIFLFISRLFFKEAKKRQLRIKIFILILAHRAATNFEHYLDGTVSVSYVS